MPEAKETQSWGVVGLPSVQERARVQGLRGPEVDHMTTPNKRPQSPPIRLPQGSGHCLHRYIALVVSPDHDQLAVLQLLQREHLQRPKVLVVTGPDNVVGKDTDLGLNRCDSRRRLAHHALCLQSLTRLLQAQAKRLLVDLGNGGPPRQAPPDYTGRDCFRHALASLHALLRLTKHCCQLIRHEDFFLVVPNRPGGTLDDRRATPRLARLPNDV